ncbi:MAG: class I SAM-dependent methyltransferase [Nevskiales bacterium]
MWKMLLDRNIKRGSLHLHLPGDHVIVAGRGQPAAHMHVTSYWALARMIFNPYLNIGECYMDGTWQPGEGGLLRVLEVLFRNMALKPRRGLRMWLRRQHRLLLELNWSGRSRRNVKHHYDVPESVYRRFLDADMQYSCAYFDDPAMTLEAAQGAKRRHIAAKLLLKPDERVLDIGSGWGGLGLHLAREHKVRVTGLTLSQEQLRVANQRAQDEGYARRVRFHLQDYRDHDGHYDAIVSVGMFEHVGRPQFQTFFDHCRALLAPRGRVLLHTIGRTGLPTVTNPWIQKYIFPGGYLPTLSELAQSVERSGLVMGDVETLHTHYAQTLAEWHRRFQLARAEIAAEMGERFCRMWEFYLQSCEASFRWLDLVVFQLQLTRESGRVPQTRDYLYEPDRAPVGQEFELDHPNTVRMPPRRKGG